MLLSHRPLLGSMGDPPVRWSSLVSSGASFYENFKKGALTKPTLTTPLAPLQPNHYILGLDFWIKVC